MIVLASIWAVIRHDDLEAVSRAGVVPGDTALPDSRQHQFALTTDPCYACARLRRPVNDPRMSVDPRSGQETRSAASAPSVASLRVSLGCYMRGGGVAVAVSIDDASPRYVPGGYRFRTRVQGQIFEGFPGSRDQALIVYRRGSDEASIHRPLFVYVSPPENQPVLFGTEEKSGEVIAADLDAHVVYHDGQWELGPGEDTRDAGDVLVHWNRSDMHSLTIVHTDVLYAVRGSRKNDVGLNELRRVAESLPLA